MTYENLDQCLFAIKLMESMGLCKSEEYANACKQRDLFLTNTSVPINDKEYIFSTLKQNSKFPVSQEKQNCVVETVDALLSDDDNASDPGLLLGKIQCGKTDTFENIIGLAFDRGIDITVVLTKGTNALVDQTIKRMRHDYRFFAESDDIDKTTIIIEDIMNNKNGFNKARVEKSKLVIVAKKEVSNLKHLNKVFKEKNTWLQDKKVLIVDDEADFASRNYTTLKATSNININGNNILQEKELKLAKVPELIDEFRTIPKYCRYLQVTATPYCLFLQPDGCIDIQGGKALSFKPRFTKLVPIHSKYIGGDQYFIQSQDDNSMFSHLYYQVSQKCVDVLGHEDKRYLKSGIGSGNIIGLTYALVGYLMATAIRIIQRVNEKKTYKSSAVLHANIDRDNHKWQNQLISFMLEQIKEYFCNNTNDIRLDFIVDSIYNDFATSSSKAINSNQISVNIPDITLVKNEIKRIFTDGDINIKIVNSDNDVSSLLDRDTGQLRLDAAANIFIGGSILDRGITINNMLCFFYGRDPKNFQQDTVLQHARFYGARDLEDMAFTRLYTTENIYNALRRMHELDERLRQWFLEGLDAPENIVTCIGFDKNIKPCAMSKIKPSKVVTISEQKRFLPIGMNTKSKKEIDEIIKEIDSLITTSPEYANQDTNGFFEMNTERAMEILRLIAKTYQYDETNTNHKGDMREVESILYHCASMSDNKIWVIHRENRNMSRIRENGGWIDAPDDGRTDTAPSKTKATDRPVLMLLKQKGEKKYRQVGIKSDGKPELLNIGWNNAEFYWPVVMTQYNIQKVLFAANQKTKEQTTTIDTSFITKDIDADDILNLSFKGDLVSIFGKIGSEFDLKNNTRTVSKGIKDTSESKYLKKDTTGNNYAINPNTTIDEKQWAGIYTYNNGKFPFILKDYKYLLLRTGRIDNPNLMLLELHPYTTWDISPHQIFNNDNYLTDYNDKEHALVNTTDIVTDENGKEYHLDKKSICQWVVHYKVKKVLKYHQATNPTSNQKSKP